MTPRIVGFFADPSADHPPLTSLDLGFPALDLVVQWHRCGMTADYFADYLACSFEHKETARTVLSTIANELLENAAKFSGDKKRWVRIVARHFGSVVEFATESDAEQRHLVGLEGLLGELAHESAEVLFARRVEARARNGLGLLILAKDYRAKLGARLMPPDAEGLVHVTLHASFPVEEIEQR